MGNAVIVTSSLGVLQRNMIHFDPPLPPAKQLAIKRMGFGALNKVALVFEEPFWLQRENASDIFGCIHSNDRGLYFMFYNLTGILRRPALVALISGEVRARTWRRSRGRRALTGVASAACAGSVPCAGRVQGGDVDGAGDDRRGGGHAAPHLRPAVRQEARPGRREPLGLGPYGVAYA